MLKSFQNSAIRTTAIVHFNKYFELYLVVFIASILALVMLLKPSKKIPQAYYHLSSEEVVQVNETIRQCERTKAPTYAALILQQTAANIVVACLHKSDGSLATFTNILPPSNPKIQGFRTSESKSL